MHAEPRQAFEKSESPARIVNAEIESNEYELGVLNAKNAWVEVCKKLTPSDLGNWRGYKYAKNRKR